MDGSPSRLRASSSSSSSANCVSTLLSQHSTSCSPDRGVVQQSWYDVFSPGASNMSFALSSPTDSPPHRHSDQAKMASDSLVSVFSPSLFSPISTGKAPLKKRDNQRHQQQLSEKIHSTLFLNDFNINFDVANQYNSFPNFFSDEGVENDTLRRLQSRSNPSSSSSMSNHRFVNGDESIGAATIGSKDSDINVKKRRFKPSTPISGDNDFLSESISEGTDMISTSNVVSSTTAAQSLRASPTILSYNYQSPASFKGEKLVISGDRNVCNCKKSKCLKLYCECFASLKLCDSCNCLDCNNNAENDLIRLDAIKATKERNPTAFQSKIASKHKGHSTGCNCKQSQCLKKYCECFQGGAFCAGNCKCNSCQNFEGSGSLEAARYHVERSGSSRRRKSSPLLSFGPNTLDGIEAFSASPMSNEAPSIIHKVHPEDYGNSKNESEEGDHTNDNNSSNSNSILRNTNGRCTRSSSSVSKTSEDILTIPSSVSKAIPNMEASNSSLGDRVRTRRSTRVYYGEHNVEVSPTGIDSFKSPPQPQTLEGRPLKKRRVKFAATLVKYPFFGPNLPDAPKIIALRCLEMLDGPGLYSLSLVNSLWSAAAMDPALWT